MTFIEQVATYLQAGGIGTLGTNLFISNLPDSVDACVAVFDTGGMPPDIYLPTKEPTFQVFVRSTTYDLGKAKIDAIRALLHRNFNVTLVVGQTYVYSILALAEGGHIGQNERGLDEFSMNFKALTR
jgi:hypothetical protein